METIATNSPYFSLTTPRHASNRWETHDQIEICHFNRSYTTHTRHAYTRAYTQSIVSSFVRRFYRIFFHLLIRSLSCGRSAQQQRTIQMSFLVVSVCSVESRRQLMNFILNPVSTRENITATWSYVCVGQRQTHERVQRTYNRVVACSPHLWRQNIVFSAYRMPLRRYVNVSFRFVAWECIDDVWIRKTKISKNNILLVGRSQREFTL